EALGLDLSAPMLDVARALAAAAGVSNVEFVRGDAQVYPLPRRHFDVELSSFGVMFFDDPAAAFGNLLGALRPGGRLAFLCWQDDAANELFGIAQHALLAHASLPAPTDLAPFADTGWVTALLGAAGAQDIQIDAVREPSRLGSDVPDVLDYMVHMGRFSRQFTQLDAATAERVRAALVDEFSRRQRPDGVWVDSAAWLVRARAA
ncbi:MAG TPA: methyltransferase domain-containing protein, partial [Rugosimonospora sp.]|nr:methyltransferase domain-containing protein [Rugosimonospora sp.]